MCCSRSRTPRRQGHVLILFALMVFVIFAVAALTIDMGFVLLTQRQMETAASAAALEGLRKRDDPNVMDAGLRDQQRRQVASDLANSNTSAFGAGPVLEFSGGVGQANALQTVQLGDPPIYKPVLELNLANQQPGDMVAGQFVQVQATEDASYNRADFTPNTSATADSFLVRMRRTNDFQNLDSIAGVSSHGPPMPLLFGRGSLIAGGDPNAGYSPRHHGITVRATAIASTRRAMSVGTPFVGVSPSLRGVTPFALDRQTLWDVAAFAANGTPVSATVDSAGNITVTTPGFGAGPHGRFVTPAPTTVGQEVSVAGALSDNVTFPVDGYVPIYQAVPNASGGSTRVLVIGFGRVTMTLVSGTPGTDALEIQLTKMPSLMAPENASAAPSASMNPDATEMANLLEAYQSFVDPLLAPALVR